MAMVSIERLRSVLKYNPRTGEFVWTEGPRRGDVAGTVSTTPHGSRYRLIHVDGRRYKAHRLAWAHAYGKWPNGEIDHINRNGLDNSLENLREATSQQNKANTVSKNQKLGKYRGVVQYGNTWRAQITYKREVINLGGFETPEKAARVYDRAAKAFFGKFAILNGV